MPKGSSREGIQWAPEKAEKRRAAGFKNAKEKGTIPDHWNKEDYDDLNDYACEVHRSNYTQARRNYARGYELFKEKEKFKREKKTKSYEEASQLAKEQTNQNSPWVLGTTSNDGWQSQNEVGSASSPAHETEYSEESSPERESAVYLSPGATYRADWSPEHNVDAEENAQEAIKYYNKHHGW